MTTAAKRSYMLVFLCVVFGGGAEAAQRTFVSTGGSDANACSLAAPCRGFAKAITVTDPGGELVVLDSGGYGSVSVNKNVTILSPAGVYAGISVFAGTDGITVMAPATKVVLRGLTINGQTGNNGVRVQAGEVHVESTVISNMAQAGILVEGGSTVRISGTVSRSNVDGLRVAPTAGTVSVLVRDSEFSNNVTAGISVSPSPPVSSAMVTVERTSVTRNGAGIVATAGTGISALVIVTQSVASENAGAGVSVTGNTAGVFVRESAITRNGTGLLAAAGGQLTACGANLLVANGTAQTGSINVNAAACLDQLAGGTGTVTSVGTGTGLTGGPITTAGTLSADTTYLQRRVSSTCAVGSSIRVIAPDGSVTCETNTNSGGTVTSVGTGTGLTGGPITGSGTVNLAATQLLPTTACAAGQLPSWNGSGWACANDSDTTYSAGTGLGLTGTQFSVDTSVIQRRVSGTCAGTQAMQAIDASGNPTCTDASIPAGMMVVAASPTPPSGYAYTGLTVAGNGGNYWSTKALMPTGRTEPAAGTVNGKIYVVAGDVSGPTFSKKTEEYSPSTNTWATKADMANVRTALSAAVVNNKIYAIGGLNVTALGTVEEFDPTNGVNGTWVGKSSMTTARYQAAAAVANNKIYVFGGTVNGSTPLATVEEYDPSSDTWTHCAPHPSCASMPTARYLLAAAALNNKIYVLGGTNGSTLTTVEEYDPASDTWTNCGSTCTPMPTARSTMAVAIANNRIYAVGGYNGSYLAIVEEFDPTYAPAGSWATRAPLITARRGAIAEFANGRIYAIGGYNGGCCGQQTTEEYTPNAVFYLFSKN